MEKVSHLVDECSIHFKWTDFRTKYSNHSFKMNQFENSYKLSKCHKCHHELFRVDSYKLAMKCWHRSILKYTWKSSSVSLQAFNVMQSLQTNNVVWQKIKIMQMYFCVYYLIGVLYWVYLEYFEYFGQHDYLNGVCYTIANCECH